MENIKKVKELQELYNTGAITESEFKKLLDEITTQK